MCVRMNLKTYLPKWHLSAFCELHAQEREVALPCRGCSGPYLLQPVSAGTLACHRWSVFRGFIGRNVFLCHETQVSHRSWCRWGNLSCALDYLPIPPCLLLTFKRRQGSLSRDSLLLLFNNLQTCEMPEF